jgi:hypothetical protein
VSIDERLYRCWQQGMGIGQTIVAIHRTTGERLTVEDVRLRFVALAERFG